jgi:ABC-type lipoprotein export system ATPase subunit
VNAAPATRPPLIRASGLGKVYSPGTPAEVVALDHVDLTIAHGEFVSIMGQSGSGKSTLMNILGGLDHPSSGSYECDGVDVGSLDAEELARLRLEKVGFVFQGFNLLSRMDALHNVMMPLAYANAPLHEREDRARAALESVGLGGACTTSPARCRVASSSGWRSRARWSTSRPCCSPTSRPARSIRAPARKSCSCSTRCAPRAIPSC